MQQETKNGNMTNIDDEMNLLDLLVVILKRKKLIIWITLIVSIIATAISLLMTPIYRAETKILPPQERTLGLAAQLMGQFGGFANSLIGFSTPDDLYVELLKSKAVIDPIIDRFNLMKVYEERYREDTQRTLLSKMDTMIDKKSGIISVLIDDEDPQVAAAMANAFVEELKNLARKIAITEASQRRLFFEEQLKGSLEAMKKAEEKIINFQKKKGVVFNPDSADRIVISDEFIPTAKIPEIEVEFLRLFREFKLNEALYELLVKQYETAKLDESNDPAIIQVIDIAVTPEKRAKPKRKLMVMIAFVSGFFFSVFIAYLLEYSDKITSDTGNKNKMEILRKYLNKNSK